MSKDDLSKIFVVYRDRSHSNAKIHLTSCDSYITRDGEITFRKDNKEVSGQWSAPCSSYEQAYALAKKMEPQRVLNCILCRPERLIHQQSIESWRHSP